MKLDALLAQTSTSAQDVSLFADMLSLPHDGRYPALDMTPEQRRLVWMRKMDSVSVHEAFTPASSRGAPGPAVPVGAGGMWLHAYQTVTGGAGRYVQILLRKSSISAVRLAARVSAAAPIIPSLGSEIDRRRAEILLRKTF